MLQPIILSLGPAGGANSLSNASPQGLRQDGARWPSVARCLLAQRYAGTPLAGAIRLAPSPADAAALVRASGLAARADWAEVETGLTDRAVLAKFRAHPTLGAKLLATGERPLIKEPHFRREQPQAGAAAGGSSRR